MACKALLSLPKYSPPAQIFYLRKLAACQHKFQTRNKYTPPYFKYDIGRRSYADIDVSTWDGEQFVEEVKHPEASREYPGLYSGAPPPIGKVYHTRPFKMEVQEGKRYYWCSCGLSKTQPFCDKTHMYEEGNSRIKKGPRFRPTQYLARESKTVYFCNCKQTKTRPFCDNTHKEAAVREAPTTIRD
ncbi:uncharacterized protein [Watersipora subatra]|uniref:uncharacterized protein n=1 Tax=Watersipora subatra TaxID=2589382 RepID=UPI00355AE8C4